MSRHVSAAESTMFCFDLRSVEDNVGYTRYIMVSASKADSGLVYVAVLKVLCVFTFCRGQRP